MSHPRAFRARCLLLLFLCLGLAAAPVQDPGAARRLQVSVLPVSLFSDNRTEARNACALIHERLQEVLFQEGGYGIVERSDPAMLGLILSELGFQNGGLVAPQEARQLGKLAGIEAFVEARGDLTVGLFGTVLSLRVRLVDVQTSKLLGLFQVRSKGRARLHPGRSVADAVASAMQALLLQLRDFRPPSAESM
ncbi:MAG: hypothetical protein P4L36_03585 [Holophaga sp.]|nr:hypothetical protein [Holophaga sp.]